MKRILLASAATLALTGAAFAQSDARSTAADVLMQNGYPTAAIDMLSEGEIAELYIASTSGDQSDISRIIASFDLPSDEADMALRTAAGPTDVEVEVRSILATNGYDENMINMMTGNEIAEIFVASTSGNTDTLNGALSSALESTVAMRDGMLSDAAQQAVEGLMSAGYSEALINELTVSELFTVYLAMTSGSESDLNDAIMSVMGS